MTVNTASRTPYVGVGESGARRSAQVDREEADTLSWMDERRDALLDSAQRWEDQAYRLMLDRLGPRPSLAQLREQVGSEEWLAALALLELSPAVRADAAQYTEWSRGGGRYVDDIEGGEQVRLFNGNAQMDWEAWAADVDESGRGWSSSEWRLFQLVAALTVRDRKVALLGVLNGLGSWEHNALDVLVQWASGGNNREFPGRYRVVPGP